MTVLPGFSEDVLPRDRGVDSPANFRANPLSDPIRNFRFRVEFYPQVYGRYGDTADPGWVPSAMIGFNSVSGLAISIENLSLREGGYNTTNHEIPLQVTYSPVTFQRGVILGSSQHWDWVRNMLQVVQGRGRGVKALFRSDVEIVVLKHPVPYSNTEQGYKFDEASSPNAQDDQYALRFRLYNAWPRSVAYSDLNAGDSALMVEQMTLVHEGFEVKWGNETIKNPR